MEKALPQIRSEEIPFEIPDNWTWVRLGDICTKIVDGDHNPPFGTKEKTKFLMISAQNINNDRIVNLESVRYLSEEVFEVENKRTKIEYGDVLLTIVGTLGRSCVFTESINACFQRSVAVITTLINSDYLKYVFDADYIQKFMVLNATGAAQLGFYLNKVEKLLIPVPPLYEQINIAKQIEQLCGLLGTIDELQQRYSSDLEVLKSKIIDAGIQGKLTEQLPEDETADELLEQIAERQKELVQTEKIKKPKDTKTISDEEIPFEIPGNWSWEKWGNVINVVSARRVHQSDWRKEGIPFYRAREIVKLAVNGTVENDLFISQELFDEFSMDRVPKPGDLMVSAVGTLGKTYVVEEGDIFYYKDASVLCFENYGELNPYYLRYLMQSSLMKNQIENNSGGTTVDTLTMVRMIQYILPIPPLAEQTRIVDKIDEMLSIVRG